MIVKCFIKMINVTENHQFWMFDISLSSIILDMHLLLEVFIKFSLMEGHKCQVPTEDQTHYGINHLRPIG